MKSCSDFAPDRLMVVDFPGSQFRSQAGAHVFQSGWVPEGADNGGDLALLTLTTPPPPDVRPARLRRCGEPARRPVRAYGFPKGLDGGVWTTGELVGFGGPWPGWVQFDGRGVTGEPVSSGFSGSGVLTESGDVIGMVVAAARSLNARVAWMIPTEVLLERLPTLAGMMPAHLRAVLNPPAPRPEPGVGPVAWSDAQRLARALSALPVMSDASARQQVIDALRPAIAGAIPRHSTLLIDIYGIVRTCLDHPGGLVELMSVIRAFAGHSVALGEVDALIAHLGLDGA